ncbi:baculoviral IAP repeat-containing protein 2 [Hypomesus transpacificus]|uniref:baculoviral IAP repeat-containing protein 2 n=1 Tax=Hypomesus transpacificus TaxID=137520 RepID=UPI001F081616|nr:baculoviral IAP repeat-containing protein 2 [Hypomesus transpacificus]XP_046876589.1 baculoviral IAP repeat-containing protein 2 [Hypomesus transpacificus]XP_046876590.1 baculoviral IAP repeat-containing protein 2 [Hypomesus transpacificus]XP_046876591.1 baculoviral IAP repeat-containing protein 2 [Hypomesus transpacificus]XP_046876593.1 baculoviral IAP repeat-containing protein 2 [Hypomesus transpacificus]
MTTLPPQLQNNLFLMGLCRNGASADLQYDNSSELFRFSTFARFPASGVTERSLARAGWFYTGVGDRVQCFRCNVTTEGWQAGDCPTERHRQLSPSCSFIQSLPSTANLLSSSHSAFSPLRSAQAIPVSGPGPAPVPAPNPPTTSQGEETVGYLNMGFSAPPPSSPLSSRGVEDMSHQRPPTCHNPSMRREQDRLDSFNTWVLSTITPSELAKAGFYYLGMGDRVACFTCGGQLSNWEPGDRAVSEHQRHYPNCRFVRGDRAENVSLAGVAGAGSAGAPVALSNVSNPAMQQSEERLLTFVNWPSRIPVRPDQLAKAGFYYVGRNDDVKCFCCDGGLRCWESGDDPWVEHAKWFPRCEYLLQEKGQEFVQQIQARFPRLFEQLLTNGDSSSREFVDPPVVHLGPGEERSEDAVMMNTPVVLSALEMGFDRSVVKQTVQSKILTSGENYKTVQELVSDVLCAVEQKKEEEKEMLAEAMASDGFTFLKRHQTALVQRLKSVESVLEHLKEQNVITAEQYVDLQSQTTPQLQTAKLIELVLAKGNAAAEVFRNWIQKNDVLLLRDLMAQTNEAASPSQDLSDLPMEEQLRRLQEERTCKVCMDKEVNIVFIPCGHLVVCKECAPSLRKCPICRGLVKGTVRTFLS